MRSHSNRPGTLIKIDQATIKNCPQVELQDICAGQFFNLDTPDFVGNLYLMVDPGLQINGQCINLKTGWLSWFKKDSTDRFIVFNIIKASVISDTPKSEPELVSQERTLTLGEL